jgi:hypothetical protein
MAIVPGTITASSGAAGTTGNTLVIHSSVQSGDILLLGVTNRDGTADPTVVDNEGAGSWAKVSNQNAATNGSLSVWWKRASANTASKTITISGGTGSVSSGVTPYRGALASGTPYGTPVPESNASGNVSTAGITTSAAGSFVCLFVGCTSNDTLDPNTYVATDPTTLTERLNAVSTSGSDCLMAHASAERSAAGATGTISWSQGAGTGASIVFELLAEPVVATGSTSVTQAADAASGTATIAIAGTAVVTQAADTVAGVAAVSLVGNWSLTQAADTIASTATSANPGTNASSSPTQDDNSASATAGVAVASTSTLTQADNTVVSTAAVAVASSAALTQDGQTSAAVGASDPSPEATLTQDAQTVTATATLAVVASSSLTQADQTAAAATSVNDGPSGFVSIAQDENAVASGCAVAVSAAASVTQEGDTVTASATASIAGADATADIAQNDNTIAASAMVVSPEPNRRKHARSFSTLQRASAFPGARRLRRVR